LRDATHLGPAPLEFNRQFEQIVCLILAPTCFAAGLAFLEARNRGRTLEGDEPIRVLLPLLCASLASDDWRSESRRRAEL
jgi:hypothetical protein